MTRYFTGKPCKRGHIAERLSSNSNCIECVKLRQQEKDPTIRRAARIRWYRRRRLRIFQKIGLRCECCKEKRIEFLTIDHRKGGGNQHRKELGKGLLAGNGQQAVYSSILRMSVAQAHKKFRTLCWNCNCAIGAWGYCPHQGKP